MVQNKRGFISIISLLVMNIVLISILFLIYTSKMEYLILNSSKNSIQASYLAEGKIYMILNKKEYYHSQLLPWIEKSLKLKTVREPDYDIQIGKNDLIEGDYNNKATINLSSDRRSIGVKAYGSYNGIKKQAIAKVNLLNEFFDMGIPVVSSDNLEPNKAQEYEDYMDYLKERITIPVLDKDILGMEAIDYDNINIIKRSDNNIYIELFRNNLDNPINRQVLNGENKIFLIGKNKNKNSPRISVLSENNLDKIVFNGVLYIEGDLVIYNDTDFKGILIIIGGNLFIEPSVKIRIEGIVLTKGHIEGIEDTDKVEINFNHKEIRKYGVYLPKFIKPTIQTLKIY